MLTVIIGLLTCCFPPALKDGAPTTTKRVVVCPAPTISITIV